MNQISCYCFSALYKSAYPTLVFVCTHESPSILSCVYFIFSLFLKVLLSANTGAKVYLVGTAHFSKESCEDVRSVIQAVQQQRLWAAVGETATPEAVQTAIASLQAPASSISVTDAEASWIGSLMPLAALAGGLSGGVALEKFGRKTTIMATSVPFMVAGITVTIASSVHMIYVGRVVAGFCIGVISLALPVYLAEILAPEVRGRLGMLPTSLGNLGVLVCYVAGARLDWSGLAAVSALLPIPFLIMMLPVPESPSFLVSRHRFRAAQMSLMKLHGDSSWTDEQFAVLKAGVKDRNLEASESHVSLLLKDVKPISLCLALMVFQQLSGINAVMFYSVTIFTSSGSLSPHLSTIILGVVNIIATVLSNTLIDKLGRLRL